MRLRELEVVVLKRNVPAHGLQKGDLGTVVMTYKDAAVEVEFIDASGDTRAVITLPGSDVRRASRADVLAARPSR